MALPLALGRDLQVANWAGLWAVLRTGYIPIPGALGGRAELGALVLCS